MYKIPNTTKPRDVRSNISRIEVHAFLTSTWFLLLFELTRQHHMVTYVDQHVRLVGRIGTDGWSEFDFHRVDQRTSDATASPVGPFVIPGEHCP